MLKNFSETNTVVLSFVISVSYLSVFAEVQRPQVCLLSCDMYIEKVYLGVPVSREVVLHNQSLLKTQFAWKEVSTQCFILSS